MAAAIALVLALLASQQGLKSEYQLDAATAERMQQREAYLRQEMSRLLQEVEESGAAQEASLLSVLQQRLFWTIAGAVILLVEAHFLARKIKLASGSCGEQGSSRSKEQDHDEQKEDLHHVCGVVRSLGVPTPSPVQGVPEMCKVLKELVGDLLGVCRVLCKGTCMPQMHPATGTDGTCETWRIHENSIIYHLRVFLQPPPGHSFILKLDTTGQLPARHAGIHVALECLCSKKQLLGAVLCFLHCPDKLQKHQSSNLLQTLCTQSYLDVEKVACWVQLLVRSAWLLLPQSHYCQLTVLPSSQTCRFLLTSTSRMNVCTEMTFAVQKGGSGTCLSLE